MPGPYSDRAEVLGGSRGKTPDPDSLDPAAIAPRPSDLAAESLQAAHCRMVTPATTSGESLVYAFSEAQHDYLTGLH
jgi:hypothetical protein